MSRVVAEATCREVPKNLSTSSTFVDARLPTLALRGARSFEQIDDLDSIREHLQCAIELEPATLLPYMCALYSLDRAANPAASETMLGIFVEEMFHLTLAANLLNAVGGRPRLDRPELMPGYPRTLPHGGSFQLSPLPFGEEALAQFAAVELPAPVGAPSQCDQYETIGQFYGAGRHGSCRRHRRRRAVLRRSGAPDARDLRVGDSGRIFEVNGLATALAALDEIVEQGERAERIDVWDGATDIFHPERDEVAHFYRISELLVGRRYRRGDSPASGTDGWRVHGRLGGRAANASRSAGGGSLIRLPHPTKATRIQLVLRPPSRRAAASARR